MGAWKIIKPIYTVYKLKTDYPKPLAYAFLHHQRLNVILRYGENPDIYMWVFTWLNYPGIFFELYISLKRGDIKLPYGERIKFLT